jgi:hypothetical protein
MQLLWVRRLCRDFNKYKVWECILCDFAYVRSFYVCSLETKVILIYCVLFIVY